MNFLRVRSLLIHTAILLMGGSCGMVAEEEAVVPAYVYIPSYTYTTDEASEGVNSDKITDMWISNAGTIIGAVGLPSLLPVQKQGPTEIRVDAGVINTGQDDERIAYPMLATHIQTIDLQPGKVDTIRPVFKYLPNIDFKFIEDYDKPGTYFKINPSYYLTGDTVIKVNGETAWKKGNYSGQVLISPNHQLLQLITNTEYEIPNSGSPVFLEIDYNSNLPLDIGYSYRDPSTGLASSQSVIQTYASSGWKKLYIDLTDEVTSRKTGTKFIFYIGIYNRDKITPAVLLDNIKLVYLKG